MLEVGFDRTTLTTKLARCCPHTVYMNLWLSSTLHSTDVYGSRTGGVLETSLPIAHEALGTLEPSICWYSAPTATVVLTTGCELLGMLSITTANVLPTPSRRQLQECASQNAPSSLAVHRCVIRFRLAQTLGVCLPRRLVRLSVFP